MNISGLLPRICESIFQRIEENDDPNIEYQVLVVLYKFASRERVDTVVRPIFSTTDPS